MKRSILISMPILLIGFGAGFLNGLLGAGGGILIVYGLRHLLEDSPVDPHAIFASAIAVMLPLSAISAILYLRNGHLEAASVGMLALPAIAGGAIGALLLRRLSPRALSRLFAAVVLVSGLVLVV